MILQIIWRPLLPQVFQIHEHPIKDFCKLAGAGHIPGQYFSPIITNHILPGFVLLQEEREFLGVLLNCSKPFVSCTNKTCFAISRTKVESFNAAHEIRPKFCPITIARTPVGCLKNAMKGFVWLAGGHSAITFRPTMAAISRASFSNASRISSKYLWRS